MRSLDNKSMEPCKIPEFREIVIQICIDIPILFSVSGNFIPTLRLHALLITCISSSFFNFVPVFSRKNWKKYLFSSFFHSSRKKTISSGSFRTLSVRTGEREKKSLFYIGLCQTDPDFACGENFVLFVLTERSTWSWTGLSAHIV